MDVVIPLNLMLSPIGIPFRTVLTFRYCILKQVKPRKLKLKTI